LALSGMCVTLLIRKKARRPDFESTSQEHSCENVE
jgi:hypothetical protein